MEDSKAIIVDVEFLAKFYRVDERTIQNWTKEFEDNSQINISVRYDRGQYDFVKFVQAKNLHYELTIKRLELGDETLYELQREYQKLRNEEKRIEILNLKNKNIDREFVMLAWRSEVSLFAKSIRAVPGLGATMIPDESTYEHRYQVIDKHCKEILDELSRAEIIELEEKLEYELSAYDSAIVANEAEQFQKEGE